MGVTWLHVSDFHIRGGDGYDRDVVLRALVRSVREYRERGRAPTPDIVFATGDIANSGKADQYARATEFFDALLDAAGLERRRLFVVPGNHDVDRDLRSGLGRTLASEEESIGYFEPGVRKPHIIHLQAFVNWYNRYFTGIRVLPEDSTCGPVELIDIRGLKLGIVPMNTALFSHGDDDHDKLWIGRRCLGSALDELQALEADVRVALAHHPLEWLHSVEASNIKASLQTHVDIILRGHLHETTVETLTTARGGVVNLASGAAYQSRAWPNRALYATLDGNRLTVFPIRYEDKPSELWTVDPSVYPEEPDFRGTVSIPRLTEGPPELASSAVLCLKAARDQRWKAWAEDEVRLQFEFAEVDGEAQSLLIAIEQRKQFLVTCTAAARDRFTLRLEGSAFEYRQTTQSRDTVQTQVAVAGRGVDGGARITARVDRRDGVAVPVADPVLSRLAMNFMTSAFEWIASPSGQLLSSRVLGDYLDPADLGQGSNELMAGLRWMTSPTEIARYAAYQLMAELPSQSVARGMQWATAREFEIMGVELRSKGMASANEVAGGRVRIDEQGLYEVGTVLLETKLVRLLETLVGAPVDVRVKGPTTPVGYTRGWVFDATRGWPQTMKSRIRDALFCAVATASLDGATTEIAIQVHASGSAQSGWEAL